MALKMNYTKKIDRDMLKSVGFNYLAVKVEDSLMFTDTYIKINKIDGNKQNLKIIVNIYTNSDCVILLDAKEYNFTPSIADNSVNFLKQGYDYLKTLDEYKDTIDLLDEGQIA